MKRLQIMLFIAHANAIGGMEIGTRRLAEALTQRGHHITILTTQSAREWLRRPYRVTWRETVSSNTTIRLIAVPAPQRSHHLFSIALRAGASLVIVTLKALGKLNVLHLRTITPDTAALAKLAQRLGVLTVGVPMGSGEYGDQARWPHDQRFDPYVFDCMGALTDAIRDEWAAWDVDLQRMIVIPNGIDTERYRSVVTSTPPQQVITVSNLRGDRRIDHLIEAWARLQSDYPDARLTIVGDGVCAVEYQALAARSGASIRFTGKLTPADVQDELQQHTIFALPSISEGMSNALIEAMTCGLAPLVSDADGNQALITHGINGWFYPRSSIDALESSLRTLLSDEALVNRLGAAARTTIERDHDIHKIAAQWEAAYHAGLDEKSRR